MIADFTRSIFDPENKDHRAAYRVFLDTGRWTMKFHCEHPFSSVVSMIERKIVDHALQDVNHIADPITAAILKERKSRTQTEVRIGADVISIVSVDEAA